MAGEDFSAEIGEGAVGFAGDDKVGEAADVLLVGFVADFGAAEDDFYVGAEAFEFGDELGGGGDVPDKDAEAEDAGVFGQDRFEDVGGFLGDFEFEDFGMGLKGAEVGEEVAQGEGCVGVFGVEGGEGDQESRG